MVSDGQNKWFCKQGKRQWAMWNLRPGCKQLSWFDVVGSHCQYKLQNIKWAEAKRAEQSKVQQQQQPPIKLKANMSTTF